MLPTSALRNIEAVIRDSEIHHYGELRFVVEANLGLPALMHGMSARERAIELFSQLRIWDTEQNSGVLIYLLFFRNRASRKRAAEEEPEQGFINEQIDQVDESTIEQASPFVPEPVIGQPAPNVVERVLAPDTAAVAQFMTSYNLGDDLYDDTFSIDANNGEFLGECGAGISDTIGVGDPKKISAFEVWLFDKNDIQTVTKVIMSSAVYNDPTARQRLSIRGEPVLAEPGKIIRLETATLRMDVRVLDMNFGRGDTLPAASFFDRMSLELNIYQK